MRASLYLTTFTAAVVGLFGGDWRPALVLGALTLVVLACLDLCCAWRRIEQQLIEGPGHD